jgi:type II secretory pathway pseudopilin PulG
MALTEKNRPTTTARARGFSVIDLLVSVAVMGLLITVLLPSLTAANEMGRRAKCASNIRQLGLGLQMYSYDHADVVPPSRFKALTGGDLAGARGDESSDTIFLRIDGNDWPAEDGRTFTGVKWDGLGILAQSNYADAPNVYYCPSHRGEHPISRYRDIWVENRGSIAGNYQYRIPVAGKNTLAKLKPAQTLIADGMRSQADYNHKVGNNMLKADLSVQWFTDSDGSFYEMLSRGASDGRPSGVGPAWETLDQTHNQVGSVVIRN